MHVFRYFRYNRKQDFISSKPVGLSFLGLAVCAGSSAQNSSENAKHPNVVVILTDDVGYGDVSIYGSQTIQTPNIERLANSGIRFTNAHASSATSTPSRYSLLTGQYAFRRKDTHVARGDAFSIIRPGQKTLPALMQRAGYITAAVGKWHLGLGDENGQDWNGLLKPGPRELGFDYSYIMAATGDRTPCVYLENQRIVNLDPADPVEVSYTTPFPGEPLGKDYPELLTKQRPSFGHDQAIVNGISRIGYMRGGKSALWVDEDIASTITQKAIEFIEQNKNHPFFLYFATNDIHVPRYPHQEFVGKSGMGPRGDAILQLDWSVGQILDVLEKNDLLENTLIVFTSDNGPVVNDGYDDQAVELLGNHKPGDVLRGGKYSAFDAGTRVPFVVCWQVGKVKQGVESPALVSLVDMYATFAALLQQPMEEDAAPDSFNQLNAWLGKDKKGRPYAVKQSVTTLTIIEKKWKYIVPAQGDAYWPLENMELGTNPQAQLYNLETDLSEQTNLATRYPKEVKRLQSLMDQIKRSPRTR